MTSDLSIVLVHPQGEPVLAVNKAFVPAVIAEQKMPVDTLDGRVYVEWDPQAPVTPYGQLVFFTQFLKTANLFDPWIKECPLSYTSPQRARGWGYFRHLAPVHPLWSSALHSYNGLAQRHG